MAEPTPPVPASSTPPAPPGSGASANPGQPIGSSPATQPVANRGMEAAGVAKLGVAVRLLEQIVPMLGAGSDAGRAVLESLNKLSKHVPSGSQSPGIEQSALQELMNKARQAAPQIAAMRAAQQGGGMPPGAG